MKTQDGYVLADKALVNALMEKAQLRTADFEAAGMDRRLVRKLLKGKKVQEATVDRFLAILGVLPDSETGRRLRFGDVPQAESETVLCLASWTPDGTPSAWRTAANGLQYRVQMLNHRRTAERRGRGKCYDLSAFDDAARQRMTAPLNRHHDVLQKLKRRPEFPCQADCGHSDANHFWVIDDHEEGLTLTDYMEREELLGRGLTQAQTLDIMEQIARALLELHAANVIRRELNPDSILIQPNGHVLLTDLELCKLLGEHPTVVPHKLPSSTWLAPELGDMPRNPSVSSSDWGAVDVYSWGKIFLFVATGKVPPEYPSNRETELPGYPKGIRHLLSTATFASYRSRPSIAQVLGVLERTRSADSDDRLAG
ncbi:MAG: protein kinase [Planctomycetaceae bacterium]|nr:protein kinase [Planctomycetaceae bacterium]